MHSNAIFTATTHLTPGLIPDANMENFSIASPTPSSNPAHDQGTNNRPFLQPHPAAPGRRGTARESAIPFISSFSEVALHPTETTRKRPELKLDLSVTRTGALVVDQAPRAHPRGPRPQRTTPRTGNVGSSASPDTQVLSRTPRFTPLPYELPMDQDQSPEDKDESFIRPVGQIVRRASTPFPRREDSEWLTASDIENLQDGENEEDGCKAG